MVSIPIVRLLSVFCLLILHPPADSFLTLSFSDVVEWHPTSFQEDVATTGSDNSRHEHSLIENYDEQLLEQQSFLTRNARKHLQERQEYLYRKKRWLSRYGSLEALERSFGKSPSVLGDLTPEETRRLYHTLLPRSLLGLYELGVMKPEELAPLAYEARLAAKEYARSRCRWTGRLMTAAFDQYRSLREKGKLAIGTSSKHPSWEEIWQKYEHQIVEEECRQAMLNMNNNTLIEGGDCRSFIDQDTLSMRIYLRILERSCATNQVFDKLFLKPCNPDGGSQCFEEIAEQLERDVSSLLSPKEQRKACKMQHQHWCLS